MYEARARKCWLVSRPTIAAGNADHSGAKKSGHEVETDRVRDRLQAERKRPEEDECLSGWQRTATFDMFLTHSRGVGGWEVAARLV